MKDVMKKIIIILIAILVIVLMLVFILLGLNKNKEEKENMEDYKQVEESFQINNKFEKINNIDDYIFIKECINKYINYSKGVLYLNDNDDEITKEDTLARLKSIIPSFVIDELNVTDNTLYDKVGIHDKAFRLNNIYISLQTMNTEAYEYNTDICAYLVEGVLIDKEKYTKEDFKIMVILDKINSTFLIIPENYLNVKNIKVEENDSISIFNDEKIKDELYNVFDMKAISDEEKCESYFIDFKYNLMYDNEYLYEILESRYKETKFANLGELKEYINNNYQNVTKLKLEKYYIKEKDGIKQYICQDKNGDLYIFYEEQPLQYSMIMDTYTIDIDEFLEKYNKSNEQTKVGLNIEKILEAINHKDYKYVYNKLDITYRNNNFKDIEQFKTFINTKFYNRSDIEYLSVSKQGDVYIYTIRIKDTQNENNSNETRIMMQLKEGTDFVVSFEM